MTILETFAVTHYKAGRMICIDMFFKNMSLEKKYVIRIVYEDLRLFSAEVIVANKYRVI